MRVAGSHSGESDLGRRELNDPEQNLRVDVLSVTFDDRGARLGLKVWSDGFFNCPQHLVVIRSSGGEVLGHTYVQTEGYSVLGLKSGLVPCTKEVDLRIRPASRQTGIQIEVYEGDVTIESVQAGEAEGTASPTYFLDDLADVAQRTQQEEEEGGPVAGAIESSVSSVAQPIITWGGGLLGLYFVLDNRDVISDLARDLITSDTDDEN